jgi:hypothetical protein
MQISNLYLDLPISRYQASVKHKMALDAIKQTNFQLATIVCIDEALGNIVAKQTRHFNNSSPSCSILLLSSFFFLLYGTEY